MPTSVDHLIELDSDEKEFIIDQKIPPSLLFNANGYKRSQYQDIMKSRDLLFAFNAGTCSAGHTLRSRSGHCIMCRPAVIAYTRRNIDPGFVYIAESFSKKLIKIGTSINVEQRIKGLNSYQYGGAADWCEVTSWACNKAGAVEFIAHQKLCGVGAEGTYYKDGQSIACVELFRCSTSLAIEAVKSALNEIGL
jgi:hypothetical protein